MTNKQRNLIKKKILMCLTEDFKNNQPIFSKEGWQVFHGTDLDMVMDAVVKGLEFAKEEYKPEVELLKTYNRWRRGEDIPAPDPTEIGKAIDKLTL